MKVIPEKYLRLDILNEFNDCKQLYMEINNMISLFQNESDWEDQIEDIKDLFKKILSEQSHVKAIGEQVNEQQRILLFNNYCILLCQLYQMTKYFDLEEDYLYQLLFDMALLAVKQHNFINNASITYLFELINDNLLQSGIIKAIHYDSLEEFVNHISSIDIESNFQSGQLIASILFNIILKQFKENNMMNDNESDLYNEKIKTKNFISTPAVDQIFELVIYLFNREKKNNDNKSKWIIAKYLAKEISENADVGKGFAKISLDILENGHRSIEDIYVLELINHLHRNNPSITKDVIYFLNNIVSNKKNQKHQIRDTRLIFIFYGRIISSKNQNQTDPINSDVINNFLNALQMKNMTEILQELVRLTIKFIKNNQNYQMLKKAPLSMESERFKISNNVVKAESSLIGLLDSSSSLTIEEKKKVIDKIHDISIQKSDTFSQFFYEEFLNIFKSTDAQDLEVKMYCKQCLSDMYYYIVGKQFCEEEIIDLKVFDDRLSYMLQKQLERANELHIFVLKSLFIESLVQKNEQLYTLIDLFQSMIYPISTTKYNPIKALIGFIFNTYQSFYQEEYFDLKTTNNNLRLSDSQKYEEFIFKTLGAKWSLDLDIFQKKSFLIHKGLDKIFKIVMKSQLIFEEIITNEEEQLDQQKWLKFFSKYMRNQKNFKGEVFIESLRKHRTLISEFYNEYQKIISSDMEEENQSTKFQSIMILMQKVLSLDENIKSGDLFIKVIFLNFLNSKIVEQIFNESCKQFKEGNITTYECLLYFLTVVAKKCPNIKSLFTSITSKFVDFFIENYKDMKNLISIYPGKMNLKQHQIKIIDYNIHLLSLLEIHIDFPSKQDPEMMIEVLERDMVNSFFIPKQQKRVIKIFEKLDKICSSKRFSMNVRTCIDNISKHKQDLFYNTCYIYYSMKLRNQMIDVNTSKSDNEIFQIMVDTLENAITQPIAWGNVQMISHQNIQIRQLMKTIISMITDSDNYATALQRNRLISILIRAMLAPKEFSPSSKISDENYLKTISASYLLKIQMHLQQNPKRYSSSFSNRSSLSSQNEIQSQNVKKSNFSLTEDILIALSILGNNDSDPIVRRLVFHLIAQNTNQLPHPFLISLHLFLSDSQESLQILSSTIIRSYAEKHQQLFYSLPQNQEKDYSRSLQYNIIYLFYIYMNHPLYLLTNKPQWKNLQKNLQESLDMLLVNKSQYPQSYELLCSIIMRLKQATQPQPLSNMFNNINLQPQANIKFKQSNIKIQNEALNAKLTQNKEYNTNDKFILLCEVALDIIVQKWTGFKKEASLKTFKLDFILPEQYYELVSIQTRNLTESMNFSKIQKPEGLYSQGSIKEYSNNFDQTSFTSILNKQQVELSNSNIGAQVATLKKEVQPKSKQGVSNNQNQENQKNVFQKNTLTNFFSSTKQNPTKEQVQLQKPSNDTNIQSQGSHTMEGSSNKVERVIPEKKKAVNKEGNKKNNKKILTKN